MLDVASFISGKLARNINEKYVTHLYLVVSAECLTATLTVNFLTRICRVWSKGAPLMRRKLMIIGKVGLYSAELRYVESGKYRSVEVELSRAINIYIVPYTSVPLFAITNKISMPRVKNNFIFLPVIDS
jgi:hypothetical protein